jgi:hypothetical protein
MAEPPNMAVSVRLEHRDVNGTTADIRHDFRIGRMRPVKARFQAFSVSQFHGMSSSRRFIL